MQIRDYSLGSMAVFAPAEDAAGDGGAGEDRASGAPGSLADAAAQAAADGAAASEAAAADASGNGGYNAVGYDLVQRGPADGVIDFTTFDEPWKGDIISNPPFGLAEEFVRGALDLAGGKVALLLPTKWMNAAKRGAWLETTPLQTVYLLGPRPSMPPGPVIEAGEKPGNGTVDFAWFIWSPYGSGTPALKWLRRDG